MSVFTRVNRHTLEAFLTGFDVGQLLSFKGISEGIENTNYFVTCERGEYVLTLIEQWEADEVPYFIDLMSWLAERGFPSARPIADRQGRTLHTLLGRPTALVERLDGESTEEPTASDCASVGTVLAELHLATRDFPMHRDDRRGMRWRSDVAATLYPVLEREDALLLRDELTFQRSLDWTHLPRSVVHADLFPDNVLFRDRRITGVIDFYYACNDCQVYDLAITVNQWCNDDDVAIDENRASALIRAYDQLRPLKADERAAWPAMLRYGALRFWISRLKDKLFPKQGLLTTIKDPDSIKEILLERRDNEQHALAVWDRALASGAVRAC